jgi:hypothetical protein
MAYRWRRERRIEGMMRGLSDVMLVIAKASDANERGANAAAAMYPFGLVNIMQHTSLILKRTPNPLGILTWHLVNK